MAHTGMIEHMFDHEYPAAPHCDVRQVEEWVAQLAATSGPDDDAGRVRMLRVLERLTCAASGLQAEITARLDESVRRQEAEAGVARDRRGRAVAAEVALARRESHHRGRLHVGLSRILADEMPCTMRALRAGLVSEWKATILVRETSCLSLADRQAVDRRLAGDASRLEAMGDRQLEGAARGLAAELDAAACVLRRRVAESARRVTLRPVPDTMTRLAADVPVAQGVAVWKSLSDAADSARAAGDGRSRGQVMADTLVERVLGRSGEVLPVHVELVVSDDVLLGTSDRPAHLPGYGPVPAELGRELAKVAADHGLATLRRLYSGSSSRQLVAMDSRSRRFPAGLARFIRLRDQVCRVPWCDAPIRHGDHTQPFANGGDTSSDNGAGLCEACNYVKEACGWSVRVIATDPHTIEIRTPTGQTYQSQAPPLPGSDPQADGRGGVPRIDLAFCYSAA
jgi:Domain of unknown function (DUF222)